MIGAIQEAGRVGSAELISTQPYVELEKRGNTEGHVMRFVLIALLLLAEVTNATETFECQSGDYWDIDGKILVTARVFVESGGATIEVAGVVYLADYRVTGFNRRWDFVAVTKERYDYAFIIKPAGRATYYDFSKSATVKNEFPTQSFFCKQTESDPD